MLFSLAAIRATLPVIVLVTAAAGLAVTSRSGAAVNARYRAPLHPLATSTCAPTVTYCYEIVNYSLNGINENYTYVTGINNSQEIVGAYSGGSGGPYASFLGTPKMSTQLQLSPYNLSTPEQDGSMSTYLASLTDDTYQVGYTGQVDQTVGAVLFPSGTWGSLQDPHQGTGLCAVTEVLGIFDSRIAVGFYEKNSATGTGCIQHAFEVYSDKKFSTPYTFVDLTPTDPSGSTSDVISSAAAGVNILGDVVGTVTWKNSAGTFQTGAWIYKDLKYTTFCYGGTMELTTSSCNSSPPYPTYANGIDFSDVVVGNFTKNGHQNGFAIYNPWKATASTGPTWSIINTTTGTDTILWSDNQATGPHQREFFAGWTTPGVNALSSGIVGVCPAHHCGSQDAPASRRSAVYRGGRPEGAYHD